MYDDSAKPTKVNKIQQAKNAQDQARQHFEELQRKIAEKNAELEALEKEFYRKVNKKAVELEGVN